MNNIDNIPESAFKRLAKLIPLRCSDNKAEAETANRRIAELLAKWGITEDDAARTNIIHAQVGSYTQADSWRSASGRSGLSTAAHSTASVRVRFCIPPLLTL